jgi:hypothetical protein
MEVKYVLPEVKGDPSWKGFLSAVCLRAHRHAIPRQFIAHSSASYDFPSFSLLYSSP